MSKRAGGVLAPDEDRLTRPFNPNSPIHSPIPSPTTPEDPHGEEAYLSAFHSAARMKPARIPNPLAYPNSPTAQAYIKERTSRFPQPPMARVQNSTYVPPPPDVHSKRRASRRRQVEMSDAGENSSSRGQTHSESVSPSLGQEQYASTSGDSRPVGTGDGASQIRAPPHQPHYQTLASLPMEGRVFGAPPFNNPPELQFQPGLPGSDARPGGGPGPHVMEPQMQAPRGPGNPFRK